MLDIGDTFISKLPPKNIPHLCIIISPPADDNLVLRVNLTSYKQNRYNDESCILNIGDHEFITRKSIINYRDIEIVNIKTLEQRFKTGIIESHIRVRRNIIKKIINGALISDDIPGWAYLEIKKINTNSL